MKWNYLLFFFFLLLIIFFNLHQLHRANIFIWTEVLYFFFIFSPLHSFYILFILFHRIFFFFFFFPAHLYAWEVLITPKIEVTFSYTLSFLWYKIIRASSTKRVYIILFSVARSASFYMLLVVCILFIFYIIATKIFSFVLVRGRIYRFGLWMKWIFFFFYCNARKVWLSSF